MPRSLVEATAIQNWNLTQRGELLRDRLLRRRKDLPSLMEVALRASLLHSTSRERAALDSANFTAVRRRLSPSSSP